MWVSEKKFFLRSHLKGILFSISVWRRLFIRKILHREKESFSALQLFALWLFYKSKKAFKYLIISVKIINVAFFIAVNLILELENLLAILESENTFSSCMLKGVWALLKEWCWHSVWKTTTISTVIIFSSYEIHLVKIFVILSLFWY